MLTIIIPEQELYDEQNNRFVKLKGVELTLEHSLVSLSKWESVWKKPFLTKENKTREETIDYIRHMTISQNINDEVYSRINQKIVDQIIDYIGDSRSATTFREDKGSGSNSEVVTSELIYYWMVAFEIPFECQKWHLNRLLNLIKICNIKNQPKKKQNRNDILKRNRSLNEARRAKFGSSG